MNDTLLQTGIKAFRWTALRWTLPPRIVEVETTKVCNLKCPNCRRNYSASISSEPGETHFTPGMLWQIAATIPLQVIRFEGDGEPMCNPYLKALLLECKQMGIRSAMTTNATMITPEWVKLFEDTGMTRIHVSFDGARKETFEKARLGAKFDQVVEACTLLGKSKVQLFMSVLLSSEEIIQQLPEYVELAKKVGATGIHYMKYQAEDLQFGTPPDLSKHPKLLKSFTEQAKKAGLRVVGTCADQPTFTPCTDPFMSPYVLLNGDVYACTYMANLRRSEVYQGTVFNVPYANFRMGNIHDAWLRDIWNSAPYQELRRRLRSTRPASGTTMSPSDLLRIKSRARGSYCESCLCRWGESGL